MREKVVQVVFIMALLYVVLWTSCAHEFKLQLVGQLSKHGVNYESILLKWRPFSMLAVIKGPSWEGRNVTIGSDKQLVVKVDLLARKYLFGIPSELKFRPNNSEECYILKSRALTLKMIFDLNSKSMLKYFSPFNGKYNGLDSLSILEGFAIVSKEYELTNAEGGLIVRGSDIKHNYDFVFENPSFKIRAETSGKNFEVGNEFDNLAIKSLQEIVPSFSKYRHIPWTIYNGFLSKSNFSLDILFLNKDNFKIGLVGNTEAKVDAFEDRAKFKVGVNWSDIEGVSITSDIIQQSKLSKEWFQAVSPVLEEIINNLPVGYKFLDIKPEFTSKITPKLHEFGYIRTYLNFAISSLSAKESTGGEFKINKVGFETDRYSLLLEGSTVAYREKQLGADLTFNITNYNNLIKDAVLYLSNLVNKGVATPHDELIDAVQVIFSELVNEYDDKKAKLKVSLDPETMEIIIGKKSSKEFLSLLLPKYFRKPAECHQASEEACK